MDIYDATAGMRWYNSSHWNSEKSARYWFGVSVDVSGRVKTINLRDNHLDGIIHGCVSINWLTHLESLCLESNSIHGSIPASIGALSNLQELNLSWNQLEGSSMG